MTFVASTLSFALALASVGLLGGWLIKRMQFVNLGFAAVLGIAAFAFARVSMIGPEYYWIAVLLALICGVVGIFALLVPRLRLSDLDWAMLTFAVQLSWVGFAYAATPFTGGAFGIPGIPRLSFGLSPSFGAMVFGVIVALISILTYNHFERAKIASQAAVVAASGELARTIGISPVKVLFIISLPIGAIVGLSSVAIASYLSFLGPEVFSIELSVTILAIGFFASRSIFAGLIGAFLLILLPDLFRLIEGVSSTHSGYFRLILSGLTISVGSFVLFGKKGAGNAVANK